MEGQVQSTGKLTGVEIIYFLEAGRVPPVRGDGGRGGCSAPEVQLRAAICGQRRKGHERVQQAGPSLSFERWVPRLAIPYGCRDDGHDNYALGMTLSAPKICSYGSSSSPTDSGMS
jgi:hypothetical protein